MHKFRAMRSLSTAFLFHAFYIFGSLHQLLRRRDGPISLPNTPTHPKSTRSFESLTRKPLILIAAHLLCARPAYLYFHAPCRRETLFIQEGKKRERCVHFIYLCHTLHLLWFSIRNAIAEPAGDNTTERWQLYMRAYATGCWYSGGGECVGVATSSFVNISRAVHLPQTT